MTKLTTLNRVCEHLEKYVFDKIWNEPYSEFRTYIVPQLLNTVPAKGIFFGRYSQVQLPSIPISERWTEYASYYVYSIPAEHFRSLVLNATEWTPLNKFCSDNLIDLELFDKAGHRVWRSAIFICQAEMNDCLLLAVESSALKMCINQKPDANWKPTDLYFGTYFDSDLVPSVRYECFKLALSDIPDPTVAIEGQPDPVVRNGEATYVLYDGHLLTGDYLPLIKAGNFVEKVFDENIITTVDVDLSEENVPSYLSGESGTRVLVHIPKDKNPEHVIITPNTCDLYLVPTKMMEGYGNPETSGCLLYMCGREEHFHQITHNDFSIDLEWLRNVAKEHGFKDYYLRMFVRTHDKTKTAIRDANYLNLLYQQHDGEIVNFLLGKGDPTMYFWRADHLEHGLYAEALIRRRGNKPTDVLVQCEQCGLASVCENKPNTSSHCPTFNKRSLNNLIDIIGYYHTLALIGKRVTHFEMTTTPTEGYNHEFIVRAPVALCDLTYKDFYPVVYVNGLRVSGSYTDTEGKVREIVSVGTPMVGLDNRNCKELVFTEDLKFWTKVIDTNYSPRLRIIIDKKIVLKKGDKVVVELFANINDNPIRKAMPTADEPFIQMKTTNEWRVYQPTITAGHVIYNRIEDPGEFDKDSLLLLVKTELLNTTLIVVEGPHALDDGATFDVSHTKTGYLGVELWQNAMTKFDNFPCESEVAFLNQHRLIRGIDYTMDGYVDATHRPGAKFYLQNVNWLKVKDNIYSVVRNDQSTINDERGFLRGQIINWGRSNPFWFDELSILTIGGEVCSNIIHDIGTITVTDEHKNGLPFSVITSVDRRVIDLMGTHGEDLDRERIALIKEYYAKRTPKYDYKTFVQRAYKIYSLYTEMIVTAFMTTDFDFELYPDKYMFEKQFEKFSEWKQRDVVYSLGTEDLKYIDIYPMFNRLQIPDHRNYYKISQMVKRLLPTDLIQHKDASNV